FILGLGSQIKAHITRRFSMEWSSPAARMREYVHALHAIWDVWDGTSDRLDFRGDFYEHTLMTPFFTPQQHGYGRPKVALAAVGPLMTQVVGEVADIFLAHGFTTDRYLRDHTLPNLEHGAKAAGRSLEDIEVALPVFAICGYTAEEAANNEALVKGQIAFYGSTPAYRPVLEAHGWEDLQPELNALSKQGEWGAMSELVTDEILEAFAIRAEPDELGSRIRQRFGGLADRISLYSAFQFRDGAGPEGGAGAWDSFYAQLRGET
ncbi:MAG TPA: TIGR03617 family F420-dependent LLM class oxidoreductase, partial [Nitriliruptorales bacterium]